MSFQTGLSGLNAASRNLDVIGNNIANANTTGMKSSRTEFADIVASSIGVGGGNSNGIGVAVGTVSQMFSQGQINITGNDLDVAINGSGFFQLQNPDGTSAYTRDGQFKLDRVGNIVTTGGANVMGYPTDTAGNPTSTTLQALQLPTTAPIGAQQTSAMTAEFNLDARAPVWNAVTPNTPLTTYGTSLTTYDAQGVAVPTSFYLQKTGSDTWNMFTDPTSAATATTSSVGTLTFGTNGLLTSAGTTTLNVTSPNPAIGAFPVTVDISNVTQYGASFGVSNLTQNGYAPGELTGLKIGEDGVITARYSNGVTQAAGQVALADFRNVQGLAPIGGGNWVETFASGQPVQGSPGQGKLGVLRSGALEESNVDLTAELVNMMTAQRAYQANAQTIKTQDQVLSTLVNLR
jgi:flagellar hook protein FlgE